MACPAPPSPPSPPHTSLAPSPGQQAVTTVTQPRSWTLARPGAGSGKQGSALCQRWPEPFCPEESPSPPWASVCTSVKRHHLDHLTTRSCQADCPCCDSGFSRDFGQHTSSLWAYFLLLKDGANSPQPMACGRQGLVGIVLDTGPGM